MKTYTLSNQSLAKVRRNLILRMGMIFVVLIGIMAYLAPNLLANYETTSGTLVNWLYFLPGLIIGVGLVGFTLYRSVDTQVDLWKSIIVELGDDYIQRSQVRIPAIRIQRSEIVTIEEMAQGLCIRTSNTLRSVIIPIELADPEYSEIKNTLSSWASIQPQSAAKKMMDSTLGFVFLVCFGIIFFATAVWLVLLAALVILVYYTYFFWLLLRSEGVDPQFRRSFASTLGFVFMIVVMKIWFLTGGLELLVNLSNHSR
jgi:hypothetical protein